MKYAYIMVIIISLLSSTSWSKTTNPMIDVQTLHKGLHHPDHALFNQYLGL